MLDVTCRRKSFVCAKTAEGLGEYPGVRLTRHGIIREGPFYKLVPKDDVNSFILYQSVLRIGGFVTVFLCMNSGLIFESVRIIS